MTRTCEVYVDLAREPRIEGKLLIPVTCAYPGCEEAALGGIVVSFLDRDGLKCRAFCSELHATFALAELAARDLGCLGSGEEQVVDMVRRHLAGEVLDGNAQAEVDAAVDRVLTSAPTESGDILRRCRSSAQAMTKLASRAQELRATMKQRRQEMQGLRLEASRRRRQGAQRN